MSRTHVTLALAAAALLPLFGAARPAAAQLRPAAPGAQIPVSAEHLARRLGVKRAALTAPERVRVMTRVPVQLRVTNVGSGAYLVDLISTVSTPTSSSECRGGYPPGGNGYREVAAVNDTLRFADTLFFYEGAHGLECPVNVRLRKKGASSSTDELLYAGSVQIERMETYTISQTWSLIPHVAAIQPRRVGSAEGSCSGLSAGFSGIVPIGVVEHDRDISLHIRSGINAANCVFDSAEPQPALADGWLIVGREWAVTRARGNDDACSINNYSSSQPSGRDFYVHAQMDCGGGPDNDNGVRLTLKSITLLGPPGKSAMDAFTR